MRDAISGAELVTSALASVEVGRLARRADIDAPRRATGVMARVALLPLTEGIMLEAIALEPAGFRSLDAIHVASALSLGAALAALCTYDVRMRDAAIAAGVRVVAPA